jgi:hypothetical protein
MNTINIDLHCDLLYYLLRSDATIDDREIGCSLPYLKEECKTSGDGYLFRNRGQQYRIWTATE